MKLKLFITFMMAINAFCAFIGIQGHAPIVYLPCIAWTIYWSARLEMACK